MVWTVGHSTRSLEEFVEVLAPYGIEAVADVRRFPGSRRMPHFGEEEMRERLPEHGLEYEWIAGLGGRRSGKGAESAESAGAVGPTAGWRHPAFRAYAVHMATAEFEAGLEALLDLAERRRTAIMCSEVLWWRCHRRLIADRLVAGGEEVTHIFSPDKSQPHVIRAPAQVVNGRLEYPAEEGGAGPGDLGGAGSSE